MNIDSWSGTLYHIFHSLERSHSIEWFGKDIFAHVQRHHFIQNGKKTSFIPEQYAHIFGEILTKELKKNSIYDVIIARDYFFISHLKTKVPIFYIGDTTFDLFKDFLGVSSLLFARLADSIERKAILNADWIVYSSEWARTNAIEHYNAIQDKVKVIEFGANLPESSIPKQITIPDIACCNLLFIGKSWINKGGNKAYGAYLSLKNSGINCSFTIIGCNPINYVDTSDLQLNIIPFIDKSKEEERIKLDEILCKTHFFILPTVFDCYGIVFCEASVYGIPSLAADVGGVHQVIRNGQNGYLLPSDACSEKYAELIKDIFADSEKYQQLRLSSRKEFEERLNWNVWEMKMNNLLYKTFTLKKDAMETTKENPEFYIPTYIINLKDRSERKKHILTEFDGREEFDVTIVDACEHSIGAIGLWNSIVKIIHTAIDQDNDVIIICEDDHYFTEDYSKEYLIENILNAHKQGADILSGGIGGFGYAVPTAKNRYWVDWFWCTQFIVIYKKFFQKILNYDFKVDDTADGVISQLSNNIMTLYPFISKQKEFGYSDITQGNKDNPNLISQHFQRADSYLSAIHNVSKFYNYPNYFEKIDD